MLKKQILKMLQVPLDENWTSEDPGPIFVVTFLCHIKSFSGLSLDDNTSLTLWATSDVD